LLPDDDKEMKDWERKQDLKVIAQQDADAKKKRLEEWESKFAKNKI